jgi:hypothetical protein
MDVEGMLEDLLTPLFGGRPVWASPSGRKYRETSWHPVGSNVELVELTAISRARGGPDKIAMPRTQLKRHWKLQ